MLYLEMYGGKWTILSENIMYLMRMQTFHVRQINDLDSVIKKLKVSNTSIGRLVVGVLPT